MTGHIGNFATYNARMRKALLDKAFFLDKVEADNFVDYGCADGTLIRFMDWMFPEHRYIGYDSNPEMIAAATAQVPTAMFTDSLPQIAAMLPKLPGRSCLILSSVIHEVPAYGGTISGLWADVLKLNPDTVVIRDMMIDGHTANESFYGAALQIKAIDRYAALLESFESVWGPIVNGRNLVHFLLKYQYGDNWECENAENYLPMIVEQFLKTIPAAYKVTFKDHYTLPYLRRRVNLDFGINLNVPTHLKLILERT